MFDFGFSELLLTAVVALLVLGPERLPRAARVGGLWLRRARASWYSMKSQVERELADDELRRSLRETRAEFDGLQQQLTRPLEDPLGGAAHVAGRTAAAATKTGADPLPATRALAEASSPPQPAIPAAASPAETPGDGSADATTAAVRGDDADAPR